MNPLLVSTLAQSAGNQITETRKTLPKVLIGTVIIVVAVILFFVIRSQYRKWKAEQERKAGNQQDADYSNPQSPQSQNAFANIYADTLRAAFNRSGRKWLITADGTNDDVVYDIAKKMHENKVAFSKVADAYNTKYADDLSKRLQSEMDADELQKFNSLRQGLGMPANGLSGFIY